MPNDCISYSDSGYFSPIIIDYLNQKTELKPLYNRFPTLENFGAQISEKQQNFTGDRSVLVSVLTQQYRDLTVSSQTQANIQLLANPNAFTVTTGHQLNLFTGPLYFLYKIISAINLAKALKSAHPENEFIPIYWMATEDHDFEEINYFNFRGKKFHWTRESSGPVGRLSTAGLEDFLEVFSLELGHSIHADEVKRLFREAYISHNNLTDATRFLANELFGNYGLVILDGDHPELKKQFAPFVKEELLQQTSHKKVLETTEKLSHYNIQVNPREINLFYMEDGLRERIIFQDEKFYINNTPLQFSKNELLGLLENQPEKFSPNVIMRPLYQEVILPNLCYIGGGGEIAYWLELKSFFDEVSVTFPMLLLRNSALLATEKQAKKADKLDLKWQDLFLKPRDLANLKIGQFSEFQLDFSEQRAFLKKQFENLNAMATQTDPSFIGAVKAQEVKQIKGLDNLEKRLLKAEKKQHADALQRLTDLQGELFPNHSLQERFSNFSEFYIETGNHLIEKLLAELNPLDHRFNVVVI